MSYYANIPKPWNDKESLDPTEPMSDLLQAVTVADILTADGKQITKNSWKGILDPFSHWYYWWP